jgi:hypothetical protein
MIRVGQLSLQSHQIRLRYERRVERSYQFGSVVNKWAEETRQEEIMKLWSGQLIPILNS